MANLSRVGIASLSSYLPEKVLTNQFFESYLDTSDEWLTQRTGIKTRRMLSEGQTNSDMATNVAKECLTKANLTAEELDYIIVATVSPDRPLPATACFVQAKTGAVNAAALDVAAACSGFLYALTIGESLIASNAAKNVLVLGSESIISIGNWNDRGTMPLFGDGCGGVLLQPWKEGMPELLATDLGADGTAADLLTIRAGGQELPLTHELLDAQAHKVVMDGNAIFKRAVRTMVGTTLKALAKCGLTEKDITWLVPHQANRRILVSTARGLGIPEENVYINIDRVGNTSAASIPIALHEAVEGNNFKKGDIICMCAFGGGLTWGSAVVRW
ncbi:MAG: beta-ketoacyl-ACP synthase III [Planctomycetota bacterium]